MKEEPLKKIIEDGQKSFLKIQNIIAEHQPVEFEDVIKYAALPRSTVFKALKDLVGMGTIIEVRREKNTSTGIKNVSYYSTPYKVKFVLLEKQETLPKLRVEAFDIALFFSSIVVFALVMNMMLREALGSLYALIGMFIYFIYYKIIKRGGKWVEIK